MPPNLAVALGAPSEPSLAASAAQATADAIGVRFGNDHPAARWARDVAVKGRALLGCE